MAGLALASKDLLERLDPDDAVALSLDPHRVTCTALGDLTNATDKARRDAPAIAVCAIQPAEKGGSRRGAGDATLCEERRSRS